MADNLVLGRGKIFFTPYAFNESTGGVKGYFGNTPSLALAQTNTKLEHYSSEAGLKVKDKSIILQSDMTLTFATDNMNLGNMTLWFAGSGSGAGPGDMPVDLGDLSVIAMSTAIYGAITFESDNPVGDNVNYWFPYVNLTPNGNLDLKGDAWQQMSFTGEALKRDAQTERLYMFSPPGGVSTAAGDTTPEFDPDSAGVGAGSSDVVTAGTVTAPGTNAHLTPFYVSWAISAGTVGWLRLHNGTAGYGAIIGVSGASGTAGPFVAGSAGSYTCKLYNNSAATGTAIATSGTVTVS